MIKKLVNSLWRKFMEWRNPLRVTLYFYSDTISAGKLHRAGESDGKHWLFLGAEWKRAGFSRKWRVKETWQFSPGEWNKDLYPEP